MMHQIVDDPEDILLWEGVLRRTPFYYYPGAPLREEMILWEFTVPPWMNSGRIITREPHPATPPPLALPRRTR